MNATKARPTKPQATGERISETIRKGGKAVRAMVDSTVQQKTHESSAALRRLKPWHSVVGALVIGGMIGGVIGYSARR
jgi:hypothetical protein